MSEMIVIGVVAIVYGMLMLVAFWLGYKAGLKDVPELPSGKIDLDNVTTSEEMDYEVSDDDYLKQIKRFKEEYIEKPEEPEHIE